MILISVRVGVIVHFYHPHVSTLYSIISYHVAQINFVVLWGKKNINQNSQQIYWGLNQLQLLPVTVYQEDVLMFGVSELAYTMLSTEGTTNIQHAMFTASQTHVEMRDQTGPKH